MKELHNKLLKQKGAYFKWHKHPLSQYAQWLFLVLVVALVGYGLVKRLQDPNALTYGNLSDAKEDAVQLLKNERKSLTKGPYGLDAEEVEVDALPLKEEKERLKLKLPGERTIVLKKKTSLKRGEANMLWQGVVEGREGDSSVALTLKNGIVVGSLYIGNEVYELRPAKNGKQVLEKIDASSFPPELDPRHVDQGAPDAVTQDSANDTVTSASADSLVQIDILTVYTPQAKAGQGGTAQIDALIQGAVDSANNAFINSQVNIRYNLVATAEVAYNDSGDLPSDLNWLMSSSYVAGLRNTYGADLVSMMVNGGNYCGYGMVMQTPSLSFQSNAFQVTHSGCVLSNLSYAHEHGHNLGMDHNRENGFSYNYYPWSYGFRVPGVFRTVMAYPTSVWEPRIPYFSNPNLTYAGYTIGVANQSDNARTGNLNASLVAQFRNPPTVITIPSAPTGLTATALSASQIRLTWTDNSTNESSFSVERSGDNLNFSQIALAGANVSSFYDSGLSPSTAYYYRVKALNSAGYSAPSNVNTAVTLSLPVPTAPTGLVATAVSAGEVRLNWTDNSLDESGFTVERSMDSFTFIAIGQVGAGVTSYADMSVSAATKYYYRVRAFNAAGNSNYSNMAIVTTLSPTTPPPPPPPPPATDTIPPTVTITSPSNGSVINGNWYTVQASATDNTAVSKVEFYVDGVYKATDTVPTYSYRWDIKRLTRGTSHTVTAKAFDAVGNTSSATITVTKQ